MKLLFLGGTGFLGRYLVEAALASGHEVTLFNRGKTNPDLFAEVEKIRGNRDGGLEVLSGRTWDAVLDTSGYLPRLVEQSAKLIADWAALYVFISTISVYAPGKGASRIDERTPVATTTNPADESMSRENYGPLKVLCENVVRDYFPTRALFIRPGILVGPHDTSDRFNYWVHKVAQGGTVIAPGDGTQPIQVIDVRDLCPWIITLVERRLTGYFNAVGPAVPMTLRRMLDECRNATKSDTTFAWIDSQELKKASLELPLSVGDKEDYWIFSVDPARAIGAGLTLRPLAETARDVNNWLRQFGLRYKPQAGLSPEQERQLLSLAAARAAGDKSR
ncbi:MAG TPA: NAD-dependent epimerase/dehydratase family protein [Planktothrix sp.]|jgi:2'-hydroxyisoflavone reductase